MASNLDQLKELLKTCDASVESIVPTELPGAQRAQMDNFCSIWHKLSAVLMGHIDVWQLHLRCNYGPSAECIDQLHRLLKRACEDAKTLVEVYHMLQDWLLQSHVLDASGSRSKIQAAVDRLDKLISKVCNAWLSGCLFVPWEAHEFSGCFRMTLIWCESGTTGIPSTAKDSCAFTMASVSAESGRSLLWMGGSDGVLTRASTELEALQGRQSLFREALLACRV